MGRKATFYLLHLILVVTTFILSGLLVAGFFANKYAGEQYWFLSILSMGLMLLVCLNVLALVYWAVKRKKWFLLPFVALALNYSYLASMFQIRNVDTSNFDIKVATYNIKGFRGGEYAQTMQEIAHNMIMEGVDVLCLQEFILNHKYSLDTLRTLFGTYKYGYLPTDGSYNPGVGIFSRYPIKNTGYLTFENTENSAIWADIELKGQVVRVINAHLQTTNFNQSQYEIAELKNGTYVDSVKIKTFNTLKNRLMDNEMKRISQSEKVLSVADSSSFPVILCGDWNSTPSSYIYAKMTKNYIDGFKTCGGGYGYTFLGFGKMLRIDYILYKGLEGKCYYSKNEKYSDHNPVLFGFSFWN